MTKYLVISFRHPIFGVLITTTGWPPERTPGTATVNGDQKMTDIRSTNILNRAAQLSGKSFDSWEEAEEWLYDNIVDERHECEVKSLGRHGQRVDFGDYWTQGEIAHFSDHWHKSPATEIDHCRFIDEEGRVIQLFYVVGENEYNAPDGYYYDEKAKKHVKQDG